MVNTVIEEKKDLIKFNSENKKDLMRFGLDMFIEKQKIMKENTAYLWDLKNKFQDKVQRDQTQKMHLAYQLKYGNKDMIGSERSVGRPKKK